MKKAKDTDYSALKMTVLGTLMATAVNSGAVIAWLKWIKRKARLEDGLSVRVQDITGRNGLGVYVLPADDTIQAFASPTGEIFFSEDMYRLLSTDEALAVALHEAGHIIHQTSVRDMFAKNAILFTLLSRDANPGLACTAAFLGQVGSAGYHERLADSYATQLGYGRELASALENIEKNSVPLPFSLRHIGDYLAQKGDELFRIHPETEHRISNLRERAQGGTQAT